MPAKSQKQAVAMRIAGAPGKLFSRNKGMLDMSKGDLHDFAATPSKGLPESANDNDADDMPQKKKSKGGFSGIKKPAPLPQFGGGGGGSY